MEKEKAAAEKKVVTAEKKRSVDQGISVDVIIKASGLTKREVEKQQG
ncbi:hypothetical protein [Taibaiella helva]|nr:hypothetical protein [Taibaiella helva]